MATASGSVREEVGFIAPIEGLRGVAVLLVMLFHYAVVLDPRFADPWIAAADALLATRVVVRNGTLGVDLFFLITGFLLVLPWLRHAQDGIAPPAARDFYRRRVLRILPAYYVHLLILFFVVLPLLRGLLAWRYDPAYLFTNLSAHIFLVHYFSPVTSATAGVNGALWSLSLEAQFYLLLPWLAPVFTRAPWRTAAGLFAIAIAWRWLALHDLESIVASMQAQVRPEDASEQVMRHLLYTQLPGYLGHFAAGMLAARAWLRWRGDAATRAQALPWLLVAASAIGVVWFVHCPGHWLLGEFTWVLVTIALGLAMLSLVSRGVPEARGLLANRPLLFAGRVSYSAYLYHLPVLLLWNAYAPELRGWPFAFPLYLAAVLAIAWLSYRYVELPALTRASASRRGAPPRSPAFGEAPPPTGLGQSVPHP
jgi:peptidoglycan/LPS O-acetylase OafA/YrhL